MGADQLCPDLDPFGSCAALPHQRPPTPSTQLILTPTPTQAAAIISGAQQEWAEFGLILGVVAINVTIGMVQEGKAEKAADALNNMLAPRCTVVRDGKRATKDADQLVVGDVVFVQSGDKVPADLRILSCTDLQILECACWRSS